MSESKQAVRGVHSGAPTCFKARCREASQRQNGTSYADVGSMLLGMVAGEQPYDVEAEEWDEELDKLDDLLRPGKQRDDKAVLQWFLDHYPRCMDFVPAARRNSFLQGVYQTADEEGLAR